MGEELPRVQKFNVVKDLAEKFKMSEYEVKEYIQIFHRMLDNLLYMGMRVEVKGVMKVEHTMKGMNNKAIGWNKVYIEGLIRGEYEKVYICRKVTKRRAQSKGSVIKNSK